MIKLEHKIEFMFSQYLMMTSLDKLDKNSVQYKETKRAYYGAIGQLLLIQRDELTQLQDIEAADTLESLLSETTKFWSEQLQENGN